MAKKRLIEFIPAEENLVGIFDMPIPASKCLPGWYRRQVSYVGGEKHVTKTGDFNSTIKHCMPALDAMSSGYIITLPQDLYVERGQGSEVLIKWPSNTFKQISTHGIDQISEYPLDTSTWTTAAWKFHNPWIVKTPPGYSTMFVHPMWHDDLPFKCFPGIVDTDTYTINAVNFPFVLRNGFLGMIPEGTPMIQAIPFRRDDWKSSLGEADYLENSKRWERTRKAFGNRYKTNFRQRKEYK